ncbi:MAG: AAA family ATPase [Kofleriaceae bacterium]|nr:AAA family ATPase [Kofleriaceae bacterium]
MKAAFVSPTFSFTRDGRRLLAASREAVTVIDTRSSAVDTIAVRDTRAIAGFVDQIWVVHGPGASLSRFGLAGVKVGPATGIADDDAMLVAAPVGVPAAVWTSRPSLAIREENGELRIEAASPGDHAIPLTARRYVTISGHTVVAPSGLTCELQVGARVLAASIVLDNSSVALLVDRSGVRELVTIGLSNARLALRKQIATGALRVAARAGLVGIVVEPRRVGILDLRSGRVVGELDAPLDVADFALDPDGTRIALRDPGTTIEVLDLRAALAAHPPRASITSSLDHPADEPDIDRARSTEPTIEHDTPKTGVTQPTSGHASPKTGVTQPTSGHASPKTGVTQPTSGRNTSQTGVTQPTNGHGSPETGVTRPGVSSPESGITQPSNGHTSREPTGGLRRPFDLRALAPVEITSQVDRATALAAIDQETRAVALWTLRAITEAWDSRRIGYGNEGKHPFEHEVAALLGMNRGFASAHVAAARQHLEAYEAECDGKVDPRSPHMPLGALALELGLSPLALDILMVVAAPGLWANAARLYGILANDPGRALVDEALVQQVIGPRASRHDIAVELEPHAPLVRLGVVAVDTTRPRPFGALTVDPIVLARLRRERPDLGTGVVARGSDRALEELVVTPGVIGDALSSLGRTSGLARISIRGRAGSGRRTLLAALAAEAGRPLGIIDVSVLPRGERDRAYAIRGALRRAMLAGLLPCVVGLETLGAVEHESADALADVMRAHPGPIAVVLPADGTPPFDPGHVAIDLPVLAESARLDLWTDTLGDAGLRADAAALGARYRIGPGTIRRAISASAAAGIARDADCTAALDAYIRQTRDARLGAHARRVERLGTWDSLVLPADIGDSLRELVARVRHRRTVFETWGMDKQMATSRGLTALFSGPPGTGKTLVAGVIARELGLDLYQVELSKLMSKWIGETERNLAAIFDAAEDGQVVLLFDEADSLFAKRTEVRSSNDRYANLEVNYLLQRLDSFEGIAILTTNASSAIDPAFKRRMSFRLSFPFPDEETRVELWRAHLPPTLPIAGPLELDRLAHKYQLSGGYIRNACLRAAFLAAQDDSAIAQHHLERAVALEYAELGKLSASGALE